MLGVMPLRELVLRLASLLWRPRRATTMETGLFEIQADHLSGFRQACQPHPISREVIYAPFGQTDSASFNPDQPSHALTNETEAVPSSMPTVGPAIHPNTELRVAFCVSPICPTARSTASTDMKRPFGAKSDRF
jgi:hypothetical protein